MRISLVSEHYPDEHGTAPDRALFALGEGLVAEGHQLEAWSWKASPPEIDPPAWCRWSPLPTEPRWRTRARAAARPRSDVLLAGWEPPRDAVAVADDVVSFPAVARSPRSVVTYHYSTRLDAAALRRLPPPAVQDLRAERRAARSAALRTAYSARVAEAVGAGCVRLPIAYPVPARPVDPVDAPVAGLLAGWHWPPNRVALGRLLSAWPEVRRAVPGARLVLGGPGLSPADVEGMAGVEVRGRVARSADLLADVAVVAFPCPPTSGPKVKVIEALAHGVPVVTTPAGVEGLATDAGEAAPGVIVSRPGTFGAALAGLLADPARRVGLGRDGRTAVEEGHSPRAAARARVAAYRSALGAD